MQKVTTMKWRLQQCHCPRPMRHGHDHRPFHSPRQRPWPMASPLPLRQFRGQRQRKPPQRCRQPQNGRRVVASHSRSGRLGVQRKASGGVSRHSHGIGRVGVRIGGGWSQPWDGDNWRWNKHNKEVRELNHLGNPIHWQQEYNHKRTNPDGIGRARGGKIKELMAHKYYRAG